MPWHPTTCSVDKKVAISERLPILPVTPRETLYLFEVFDVSPLVRVGGAI